MGSYSFSDSFAGKVTNKREKNKTNVFVFLLSVRNFALTRKVTNKKAKM